MGDTEFLTTTEVQERYRMSRTAVIRNIREGKFKGFKVGGSWRLYADQFKEMEKAA